MIENLKKEFDSQNMFQTIKDFPKQAANAIEIGRTCPVFDSPSQMKNIVVLGMGGSAIGGDLLRSYCAALPGAGHLRVEVSRSYTPPENIFPNTYIIASSYSGGTEETLSSLNIALEKTKRAVCITSGGELAHIAGELKLPTVIIPGGFMPRAALGYSFFPMLHLLMRCGAFEKNALAETEAALVEMIAKLNELAEIYSDMTGNPALELAQNLHGKIPVVYSASSRLDAVNLRFRCQIQENSKQLAFGALLPEMNHNEINSYAYPADLLSRMAVVTLQDPDDHPKLKLRFDALTSIMNETGIPVYNFIGTGKHLLTRMFEIIYLADWVSYYLALLNGADPTPIPIISRLKELLQK